MLFTDPEPASDESLLAQVYAVSPRFLPGEVLHRSATSLVVAGTVDMAPVVAKVLAGGSPFWREQFVREIEAYRLFATVRPPVRVPELVAVDDRRMVLVLERLFGRPLAYDRHPSSPIPSQELAGALTQLRGLNAWRPGVGEAWQVNYAPRIERAHRQGALDDTDRAALDVLVARSAGRREFCHGDMVLANVVKTATEYGFVDWSSAGLYLPGFDLAQVWVLLGEVPGPRLAIEDMVDDAGPDAWPPFLVNLLLLLGRELRTFAHRTDELGRVRRAHLAAARDEVRERVRRAAAAR